MVDSSKPPLLGDEVITDKSGGHRGEVSVTERIVAYMPEIASKGTWAIEEITGGADTRNKPANEPVRERVVRWFESANEGCRAG